MVGLKSIPIDVLSLRFEALGPLGLLFWVSLLKGLRPMPPTPFYRFRRRLGGLGSFVGFLGGAWGVSGSGIYIVYGRYLH